jgi:D-alanyl-D-alanine endopeptidase (penicillin-binding protein 7)
MKLLVVLLLLVNTAWARNEPSVLLYDNTTNTVLLAERTQEVRPMASITKVMTAMTYLDLAQDLEAKLEVYQGVSGVLLKKQYYTRRELLIAMLVRSDNSAAETLARDHPNGRHSFMTDMNAKAQQLGMSQSHFDDPSGLSQKNVGTALDIMNMLKAATTIDFIRQTSIIQKTEIAVKDRKKPVKIIIQNTNIGLLEEFNTIVLSKTGLTNPAGWCVSLVLEERHRQFILIVLGAPSKDARKKIVERVVFSNLRELN